MQLSLSLMHQRPGALLIQPPQQSGPLSDPEFQGKWWGTGNGGNVMESDPNH